jgi:oligopeptide transport system substrate-binding protein
LREVRFVPTDDEGAEERAFRAGELHATFRLPQPKVAAYAADHPAELHLQPILRTDFIAFNLQRAPFKDAHVRRAFSLAVDRVRLVHAALGQMGEAATTWVRPGTGGFQPTPRFGFDPAAAAAELAAAGYPKGAGFPVVELTLNGMTGAPLEVAEILQQMWKDNLGIRVELRPMEFKSYLAVDTAKDFQFLLEGYSTFPDPHDMLSWGARDDPNNDASVDDPEFERAYAASDRVRDPAQRLAACDAVEAINARQVYYAPLYYVNRASLLATSVRGWHDHGVAALTWRDLYLEP